MKIQTIDTQLWWIALPDETRPSGGLDVAAFFAAIKDKFAFSRGPILPAKPGAGAVEFAEGALRLGPAPIIISKIDVYNDGINIAVHGSNENADFVLDVMKNIFHSFGLRLPITQPLQYYLSVIVADFDVSLDNLFPASFLEKISKVIPVEANAQFLTLGFNADKSTVPGRIAGVNPTAFSIGRRIEVPYSLNRYFSQANATTADHIGLLEELESLAKKNEVGHRLH
jgi:hypothetical protein